MYKRKLFLLLLFCAAVLILLYVCRMLAPLLDDVWKILAVGTLPGAALGFWIGVKWKEADIALEKEIAEHKDRL